MQLSEPNRVEVAIVYFSKTLFVLGAGASAEVKLPLGPKLLELIARRLNFQLKDGLSLISGDPFIYTALRGHDTSDRSQDDAEFSMRISSAFRIKDNISLAPSIDNFVHSNRHDKNIEFCAKLAIASEILESERNSQLNLQTLPTGAHKIVAPSDAWHTSFFRQAFSSATRETISDALSRISFIIFNYDRCIEHFLFHSLQDYYGISAEEAASALKGVDFIHPFGSVGQLPWQDSQNAIEFGHKVLDWKTLMAAARKIKTFTEESEDKNLAELLLSKTDQAESVIFLGLAFHRQNLEMISRGRRGSARQIFATGYALSDPNCRAIKEDLGRRFSRHGGITVEVRSDLKCSQLLPEYERYLV